MDVYDAIVNKRDIRSFSDDPVSDDDLHKVLQAGRMAGSAKNQQLNRIVVVTDAGHRTTLGGCGKFADWLPSCPVVMALVVPKEGGKEFDIGRMAQNMMVAAHGLGPRLLPRHLPRRRGSGPPARDLPLRVPGAHGRRHRPSGAGGEEEGSSPRIPLDELVNWGRWAS